MNGDECPVCFEDLAACIRTTTPCAHSMCLPCLMKLETPQRCPICRASLVTYIPTSASSTPTNSTTVSLNVATITSNALQEIVDRVRVAQVIERAVQEGAAPRNQIPLLNPRPVLRRTRGLRVLPPQEQEDSSNLDA